MIRLKYRTWGRDESARSLASARLYEYEQDRGSKEVYQPGILATKKVFSSPNEVCDAVVKGDADKRA